MSLKRILCIIFLLLFVAINPVFAEDDSEWEVYKAKHFFIYYQDTPIEFIKNVEQMAELLYEDVADQLGFRRYEGWTWDDRAKIYIYDDQEHYIKSRRAYKWSHGVASPKDKVIRSFPADSGFFDTLLPHEIGHIIFREFIGFRARVSSLV